MGAYFLIVRACAACKHAGHAWTRALLKVMSSQQVWSEVIHGVKLVLRGRWVLRAVRGLSQYSTSPTQL